MSGGWHDRDVPTTSVLNISTKRISVVIFSVLVHQMCVLNTKKLVIAYLFSFRETSYGRPKNVPKWSCSVTSLWHPQDVNLNIFHQNRTIRGCPRDVVCWLGRDLEIATPRARILRAGPWESWPGLWDPDSKNSDPHHRLNQVLDYMDQNIYQIILTFDVAQRN